MKTIAILIIVAAVGLLACNKKSENSANNESPSAIAGDTPTESYKRLYAAVKSKNTDAIKREMTRRTISFAEGAAARQNTPVEKMFENGLTATTFSETLPQIRDERVNGLMGAVEIYNSKDSKWEDLPFILEDGRWKLAIGEMFAGTHQSPGKGRAQKEAEAANAAGNANVKIIRPDANVPGMTNAAANSQTKPVSNIK